MLGADAARCCLVAALVVLAMRHVTSLALLGPIAAGLGAGEGLFMPTSFSIMPTLLKPERLQAANGINAAALEVGSVLGPALGGVLVASAGSAPAFAVDAATFAVSALTLAMIRARVAQPNAVPLGPSDTARPATPQPAASRAQPDATAGPAEPGATGVWQLLRRERLLQVIIAVAVAANFTFGGTFQVALPDLAHARFGAAGYGALIACFGAGGLMGTLGAARGGAIRRPAMVAFGAFLIESAAAALIPFLGGLPGAAAAALALGLCNGFGNVVMITLLQQWAPGRLLGHVMSLVMLASMGTFPLSVAVTGVLVRSIGPSPFFPIAGAVLAVTVLGALTQPEIRGFGSSGPLPATDSEAGSPDVPDVPDLRRPADDILPRTELDAEPG